MPHLKKVEFKKCKPIFIIGCPRSGTTITLKIMGSSCKFAWVSNLVDRSPFKLHRSRLNRAYDLPYLGDWLYLVKTQHPKLIPACINHFLPEPVEPWSFWNAHLSNFQWERGSIIPPRRRSADDISSMEIKNIRDVIYSLCRLQGKEMFLSKYTDFPRIRYLTQAFPNAKFIHIIRDGRAVAASYLTKIESGDFGTWHEREWWIKGWPKSWREEWLKKFNTPLSLVAFQWKFFVNEIWQDSKSLNTNQYLEANYKDIITNPKDSFLRIFEFCGLDVTSKLDWYLHHICLNDMNYKWEKKFTEKEKKIFEDIIHEQEFKKLLD